MPLGELILGGAGILKNIFGENADRQAQLDAAKHSVEWRVEDAKRAGINPLAALGMNPASMSPVAIDGSGTLAGMGQSIDRAVDAGSTESQRSSNAALRLLESQVEGQELDNDIRRMELASRSARLLGAGTGPAVPQVVVDGDRRTLNHPVFGSVTREGMAAQDLENEVGEMGDWLEGANYANEWVRKYTGRPLVSEQDIQMLKDIGRFLGRR